MGRGQKRVEGGLRAEARQATAELWDAIEAALEMFGEVRKIAERVKEFRLDNIKVKAENMDLRKAIKEKTTTRTPKATAKRKRMSSAAKLELEEKVRAYLVAYPYADWKQIFVNIENPYKSAWSMASSLNITLPDSAPPNASGDDDDADENMTPDEAAALEHAGVGDANRQ